MANERRLIDANEVERKLRIAIALRSRDCNSNAPVIARSMEDALQRVIYAPTVDAVEVVHGRWEFSHTTTVEKFDVVKCSNCGHEAFAIAVYVKEGHYCPNCGAKMDGDGNG